MVKKIGRPWPKWVGDIKVESLKTQFRIKDLTDNVFGESKGKAHRMNYVKVHAWITKRMGPEYFKPSENNIPFSYYSRDELIEILNGGE